MYTIVVVDDEPWSLKGIHQVFQWEKEGFKPVLSTTNVEEALHFICNEKVDVVFTDIRMPEISGLELMKLSRERSIDSEFVFVSGFAEFDYVQKALKEGAFDYFLKPISQADAAALLKRLKNQLDHKRLHHDVEDFDSLIEGRVSPNELLESRIHTLSGNYYCALSLIVPEKITEAIINKLSVFSSFTEFYLGSGKYSCVISTALAPDSYMPFVDSILSEHPEICIGISTFSQDLQQIPKLLKEAEAARCELFIKYRTGKFQYQKSGNGTAKALLANITKLLETSQYVELLNTLNNIPDHMHKNMLGIHEVLFFWNQLVAYLTSNYDEEQLGEDLVFMEIEQLTLKFKNLEEVCEYLKTIFLSLNKERQPLIPEDAADAFKALFIYINEHYQIDLSLTELSERYHIGFTYASSLFKKHIGKNFSEYISDLRMKKAVQLMSHSSLSIEEICFQVGYNDYYYFNRIFKKYYGMPPFKYRKQNKLNK